MTGYERYRVQFVCTGNICRSPMAEIVFRDLAERAGLGDRVVSTSSGTGDWHVGKHADVRTIEALRVRGYDGAAHRARQFDENGFAGNDLVVALDRTHDRSLRSWAGGEEEAAKIALLLAFDSEATSADVPDPYYADDTRFDEVLAMIESACGALLRQLEPAIRSPRSGGSS